jgi:hypothetical protein
MYFPDDNSLVYDDHWKRLVREGRVRMIHGALQPPRTPQEQITSLWYHTLWHCMYQQEYCERYSVLDDPDL